MVTLSHGELLLPAAAFCFHICTLPLIWSCGIEADDAAARTQDCKRPFADRRRAVQRRPNGPRPAVCPAEPVCRAMPERQRQALPSAKPPCGPRCRHIQTAHGRLTGRRIGTRRLPAPILFALAARLSLSGQICTAGCRGGRLCPRDISGWHRSASFAVSPQKRKSGEYRKRTAGVRRQKSRCDAAALPVYFAYSTALVSRMTLTLIWPGYSSSASILRATSCASRIILSSVTSSGLTIIRTSRPA